MYHGNFFSSLVLATILALNASLTLADNTPSSFTVSLHTPKAAQPPSPNTKAAPENRLSLSQNKNSLSYGYTKALGQGNGKPEVEGTYGQSELETVEQGETNALRHCPSMTDHRPSGLVYTTDIKFGDETFTVVLDTGSSDTWLVENTFTCNKGAQSACAFGNTYTRSPTFKSIANQNFEISYADGEFLDGIFGTEKVTLAGVTVNDQQVALVQRASWRGDGASSGVLGLAFPANTRAFSGMDYSQDTAEKQLTYSPLFTTMYTNGSVPPLFSMALDRDGNGEFAIGGTPDVKYVPVFASSPFQLLTAGSGTEAGKTQYTFYSITTNGFEYKSAQQNWNLGSWLTYFGNPNDPSKVQVIIDSGTTVNYLPANIADSVNKLFDPPATYNTQIGYYTVKCDAKAPQFGVKIGSEIFYVNPLDMIIRLSPATCITGVTSAGTGGNSILGHAFLKNVLAVFDVGASEMRFAAREYY